jgi:hypothetical protein
MRNNLFQSMESMQPRWNKDLGPGCRNQELPGSTGTLNSIEIFLCPKITEWNIWSVGRYHNWCENLGFLF